MSKQQLQFDKDRLNAISIVEVAQRLGNSVRRVGINHMARCPWHDDHHPSLSLVAGRGKNFCHCFSCGKGGDVISYAMQCGGWTFQEACQWLAAEFGIGTVATPPAAPRPKPLPPAEPPAPEYTYIPTAMLDPLVSAESSLCQCLRRFFQPEAVEWLAEEYRLGCYTLNGHDDCTVFPSIDDQGRVCNLKVQHYETDYASPRFAHSDQTAYWLGRMWANQGLLPRQAEFRSDCLFGAHLLGRYPSSVVALVESPKNALFAALSFPRFTWVAAGNKGNLKRATLLPLQGRDVVVMPDCDAVDEWAEKVASMADLANFTVSDFCRRMAPADQPKFDVADYLVAASQPLYF